MRGSAAARPGRAAYGGTGARPGRCAEDRDGKIMRVPFGPKIQNRNHIMLSVLHNIHRNIPATGG